MENVFLELWFEANSLEEAGFYGRSEIEDRLEAALSKADLGEVTGGGGGIRGSNIDLEVNEERFEEALAEIKRVLRKIKAPANTLITRYEPEEKIYRLSDAP